MNLECLECNKWFRTSYTGDEPVCPKCFAKAAKKQGKASKAGKEQQQPQTQKAAAKRKGKQAADANAAAAAAGEGSAEDGDGDGDGKLSAKAAKLKKFKNEKRKKARMKKAIAAKGGSAEDAGEDAGAAEDGDEDGSAAAGAAVTLDSGKSRPKKKAKLEDGASAAAAEPPTSKRQIKLQKQKKRAETRRKAADAADRKRKRAHGSTGDGDGDGDGDDHGSSDDGGGEPAAGPVEGGEGWANFGLPDEIIRGKANAPCPPPLFHDLLHDDEYFHSQFPPKHIPRLHVVYATVAPVGNASSMLADTHTLRAMTATHFLGCLSVPFRFPPPRMRLRTVKRLPASPFTCEVLCALPGKGEGEANEPTNAPPLSWLYSLRFVLTAAESY